MSLICPNSDKISIFTDGKFLYELLAGWKLQYQYVTLGGGVWEEIDWTLGILLHGKKSASACCIQCLHRTSTALMSSPAFCLKNDPVFYCEGSSCPLLPLLPWNWLYMLTQFSFCPLVFLSLSIPANPSFSYAFVVVSFSVSCSLDLFQCCFRPSLFFLPVFSLSLAVLSSATHTHTLYASPHVFLFFHNHLLFLPSSPFLPEKHLKWKENTLRLPSLLFLPDCFPPLPCFLSHQGLVTSGLFIVFNMLNDACNFY